MRPGVRPEPPRAVGRCAPLAALLLVRCASLLPSQAAVQPGKVQDGRVLVGAQGFAVAMGAYDYRRALDVAQAWAKIEPGNVNAAIGVAQASTALADLSTHEAEMNGHVDRALSALQPFLTKDSGAASLPVAEQARLHYLYAEALGLRLRALGTGAIELLPQIAEHGEKALALAPTEDDGAPMRLLGMVLIKAPAWPHGPGDSDRGIKLLQEAIERYPRRAEGYIHYADALLDQSRVQEAQRFLARGRELTGNNPRTKKLYLDIEARIRTNKKVKQYE